MGSDETRLLAELRRQHFVIKQTGDLPRYPNSATYEARQIVCKLSWTISWSAEEGRIQEISGGYGDACL